jgi:hypothetical protein
VDASWQAPEPVEFGLLAYIGGLTVDEAYRDEKAGVYDDAPGFEPGAAHDECA